MTDYFSVAALFIMFREALEAAVIIAVLLQLMEKLQMRQLKKQVWIGAIGGVAISIVLGIIFVIVFYVAGNKLLSGNAALIFKGCIAYLASVLITLVAFHMLKFYNLERKWKKKLEAAATREATERSCKWSILLLTGSATLREGVESVLFLTGVSAGTGVKSIIIPGILGIILGAAVGGIIFYTGKSIRSLKWFFIFSCGLLLFIAAGLVCTGTGMFQSAELFGVLWPYEYRPWYNTIVWDTSSCCDDSKNKWWALVRALFGYVSQPTALQLFYYLLFWVVVLALFVYKWRVGTLTDRKAAELDDMKSFARHKADGAAGIATEGEEADGGGSAADEVDLEKGQQLPAVEAVAGGKPLAATEAPRDSAMHLPGGSAGDSPRAAAGGSEGELSDDSAEARK